MLQRDRSTAKVTILSIPGDQPPTEFCIFKAGTIETTKGSFTFDAKAAAAVMADYQEHGIDLMIDYDHASLSGMAVDPALSGKAAGWFNLELRGGELWAVNVRWTEPASDALKRKEWRFMSPAFHSEDGRITSLLNVALTNLPATRRLDPLMAASLKALGGYAMTLEQFLAVCKALKLDMTMPLADAMKIIRGEAVDTPPAKPNPEDAPPPAGDGGADDAKEPPAAAGAKPMPAADAPKDDKPEEVAASVSRLMRLTGVRSFVAAIDMVDTWRGSHLKLESETQKLAQERAVLESAERRKGCVDLVVVAGRAPATVWADDKAEKPKPYLAQMSIANFREYVSDALKACGKAPPKTPAPPVAGATDAHGLDERELNICKEQNCEPAVFAELKKRRAAHTAASQG